MCPLPEKVVGMEEKVVVGWKNYPDKVKAYGIRRNQNT